MNEPRFHKRTIFLALYLVFAILPVYWMLNMSFKTNNEILSTFSLWPRDFTFEHYRTIFTDVSWYSGYINSIIYVSLNTVISLLVAIPALSVFAFFRNRVDSLATECATTAELLLGNLELVSASGAGAPAAAPVGPPVMAGAGR